MYAPQTTELPDYVVHASDLLARCLGRVDIAERALARFQASIDGDVHELERAFEGRIARDVASIAHRVRGAALAVAAERLSHICHAIESAAASSDWRCISGQLGNLRAESQKIRHLDVRVVLQPTQTIIGYH